MKLERNPRQFTKVDGRRNKIPFNFVIFLYIQHDSRSEESGNGIENCTYEGGIRGYN
jgi:hypothetical protein